MQTETRLLSPKAVCGLTSLSRTTLDRLVAVGSFPSPIRLTPRRLAYDAVKVDEWLKEKVAA